MWPTSAAIRWARRYACAPSPGLLCARAGRVCCGGGPVCCCLPQQQTLPRQQQMPARCPRARRSTLPSSSRTDAASAQRGRTEAPRRLDLPTRSDSWPVRPPAAHAGPPGRQPPQHAALATHQPVHPTHTSPAPPAHCAAPVAAGVPAAPRGHRAVVRARDDAAQRRGRFRARPGPGPPRRRPACSSRAVPARTRSPRPPRPPAPCPRTCPAP